MELIIGGAYQGKHGYAKERYGELPPEKLFDNLHLWVRARLEADGDPLAELTGDVERYTDMVIICEDIFCGVVPMDAFERRWREATGRCLSLLSARADTVTRLFCGIPTVIKMVEHGCLPN